ncbi:MAG: hypothetical protein AB8H03_03670, partial [Saprospiraceae bacterium]
PDYKWLLYFSDVFKPGMIGPESEISTNIERLSGYFTNRVENENPNLSINVGVGASSTLAWRAGDVDNYGFLFETEGHPTEILRRNVDISGEMDIRINKPPNLGLEDILHDCSTTGNVYWGDPTVGGGIIGEFKILCDFPCPCSPEQQ